MRRLAQIKIDCFVIFYFVRIPVKVGQ